MTFKLLAIGQIFRFESEFSMPFSGMKSGPWRKISTRRYVHVDADVGIVCTIGTISCKVTI